MAAFQSSTVTTPIWVSFCFAFECLLIFLLRLISKHGTFCRTRNSSLFNSSICLFLLLFFLSIYFFFYFRISVLCVIAAPTFIYPNRQRVIFNVCLLTIVENLFSCETSSITQQAHTHTDTHTELYLPFRQVLLYIYPKKNVNVF